MVFCAQTNGHIQIDIEPEELQSIGEVLVQSYLTHNLIQRQRTTRNAIISQTKKFACNIMQLTALIISLVSANLLTAVLQPIPVHKMTTYENITTTTTVAANILKPSEMCPYDFGCDDYLCWRSCDTGKKETNGSSWCYTSPQPKKHEFKHCVYPYECSPCWACIGPCNSDRKYWFVWSCYVSKKKILRWTKSN